jgi:O-antigen/teichoic acid export membrane protein
MGASMAIFSVYNRIDTFILQFFKGEAATGIYVLAYKVHDNLVLGAAYLMNAFFPVIANFTTQTLPKVDLKKLLQKAFDLLLTMAIPMVILIFLLAPMIIKLLGGQEFLASFGALRILIFATGVAYLNHLTGYSLVALGRQRVHLKFCALTLISNIILNFIFIPQYSFIGAALVTVLTETLIFVLTFSYLRRTLNIRLTFGSFPKTFWELITKKGKVF